MSDLDAFSQEGGDRPVERSPRERYIRFDERLGTGAYKTVYKAYDTDQGIDVAWNAIDIGVLPSSEKNRIIQEVQLLQKLEHKNIINFYGSWFSKEKNQVVFITEIMTSGNLKSYIKRVQFVKWKIIKRWCIQILEGLHYLHSQPLPVIHRDLKCDNIFINGNTGDLRIGDLGLSTQLAVHKSSRAQSVLGTPEFMAPELYDESYDEKVDIYAFGMCVLEMVTKEVPYSECINPAQIYKKVTAGIRPMGLKRIVSQAARDFIELCLSRGNGEVDVSAEYLLQHPFLKAHENDGDMVRVLDDDALARAITPVVPEMSAMTFAEELNMESGSKVLKESSPSRQPDFGSVSLDGNTTEITTPAAVGSQLADVPAEEKSVSVQQNPSALSVEATSTVAPSAVSRQSMTLHGESVIVSGPTTGATAVPGVDNEPVVDEPMSGTKDVDNDVAQFLSTMPGSESKIRNDRIAVMGGRGHRIEIDEAQKYSDDEEDGVLLTAPVHQPQENDQLSGAPASTSDSPLERARSNTTDNLRVISRPPSAQRKRGKRYEIKATKDPENDHSILLNLRIAIDGKSKEIKFPFNLFTESSHEVACELAVDVGILEPDLEDIADSISFLVTEGKINNLLEFERGIWDEAPEPHSFSSKPLPHVSKMQFDSSPSGAQVLPGHPVQNISVDRIPQFGNVESLQDPLIGHGSGVVSQRNIPPTAVPGTQPLLSSASAPDMTLQAQAPTALDSSVGRNDTGVFYTEGGHALGFGREHNASPSLGGQSVHAVSDTGVFQSDDFAGNEGRDRGMSLGSLSDANYIRSVRQYDDRMIMGHVTDRESSLEAAIRSEEEKHQREIERIRKKMQQFNEKTAWATQARHERMRLGTDDMKIEDTYVVSGEDAPGARGGAPSPPAPLPPQGETDQLVPFPPALARATSSSASGDGTGSDSLPDAAPPTPNQVSSLSHSASGDGTCTVGGINVDPQQS